MSKSKWRNRRVAMSFATQPDGVNLSLFRWVRNLVSIGIPIGYKQLIINQLNPIGNPIGSRFRVYRNSYTGSQAARQVYRGAGRGPAVTHLTMGVTFCQAIKNDHAPTPAPILSDIDDPCEKRSESGMFAAGDNTTYGEVAPVAPENWIHCLSHRPNGLLVCRRTCALIPLIQE